MRFRHPVFLLLIVLPACASQEPAWTPIVGTIVARDVRMSSGSLPTMHVKEPVTEECGIIFTLRESTLIHRRTPTGLVKASIADLTVGRRVAVWTEFIAESCPGQSGPHAVEIIE